MTPKQLKQLRERMGLSAHAFGLRLGYVGNSNTIRKTIWRYESGERPIPPRVILKCQELAKTL